MAALIVLNLSRLKLSRTAIKKDGLLKLSTIIIHKFLRRKTIVIDLLETNRKMYNKLNNNMDQPIVETLQQQSEPKKVIKEVAKPPEQERDLTTNPFQEALETGGQQPDSPVESRSRIVDGYHWNTLDECSDQIFDKAGRLDETSFPLFLTQNCTNEQFVWLLRTFKKNHIVFLDDFGRKVLAAGFSAPIHLVDNNLPENGWEGTVNKIISDYQEGREPNALVGFSASVSPDASGQRMGDKILRSFVQRAKELGFSKVIVPARPSGKSRYPDTSMEEYINLHDKNTGEHIDPWIRAHQRCGGKVMGIGKNSHVVRSPDGSWPSTGQWQKWTGMGFPRDGEYDIPRGNAKLYVHDGAGEYREECIWIEYDIND